MNQKDKSILIYLILALTVLAASFLIIRINEEIKFENILYYSNNRFKTISQLIKTIKIVPAKVELPNYVRGLYLTAYSAGQDGFRKQIIERMSAKDYLNTVVIDIKDSYGRVFYDSQLESVKALGAITLYLPEVKKILDDFHQAGIYVVARQVVFQDPILAKNRLELALKTKNGSIWYDYKGLAWAAPQNQEVWDYNLAIAKEAVALGFDEINFDYIRYPSDGPIKNLNYNLPEGKGKADVLKDFYAYASLELSDKTVLSIDMFGLVLDHTDDGNDLKIGQVLADTVDYIDYICPMVYPSHYPVNYLGFENPALYPKAVISHGLKASASTMTDKRAKLRPWLQAFNIGAIYDQSKIRAQIEAVESATTTAGWLLWNARNYYPDYVFEE